VVKFRCTLNFLLLTTLAVLNKLSGYKMKCRHNEAGSSKDNEANVSRETACKNLNAENDTEYLC
jgi:hypothetical protein